MNYSVQEVKVIFQEFFTIERVKVRWELFDGRMGDERTRYVVRRGHSVGVIPECAKTGKIVLVQQFRYPAACTGGEGYLWEIPAGMIAGGENPLSTAKRELYEEIGVEGEKFTPLISFFLSPGALDEEFQLYSALIPDCSDLGRIGGNKREHEDILIEAFGRTQLLEMIKKNEIRDVKTIASLLYYFFLNSFLKTEP